MALTLGIHKNSTIYFGDVPVRILRVDGYKSADLVVGSVAGIGVRSYTVYDDKATEILPKVFVSCGLPRPQEGVVPLPRLVIEAPHSMVILRQSLYGKPRPKSQIQDPQHGRPSRVPYPA